MTAMPDRDDEAVRRFAEACQTGSIGAIRAVAVVGVTVIEAKVAILWFVLNPAKLHRWHLR